AGASHWSKRAKSQLTQLAHEYDYLKQGQFVAVTDDEHIRLFTFAGASANHWIAAMLRDGGWDKVTATGLVIRAKRPKSALQPPTASDAVTYLRHCASTKKEPLVDPKNRDYQ